VSASIGWALGGACVDRKQPYAFGGNTMKIWTKPEVREQEVGLEVTSYLPAEIDVI
jgi:coenzyme PQQ precursor peptide PqqA